MSSKSKYHDHTCKSDISKTWVRIIGGGLLALGSFWDPVFGPSYEANITVNGNERPELTQTFNTLIKCVHYFSVEKGKLQQVPNVASSVDNTPNFSGSRCRSPYNSLGLHF